MLTTPRAMAMAAALVIPVSIAPAQTPAEWCALPAPKVAPAPRAGVPTVQEVEPNDLLPGVDPGNEPQVISLTTSQPELVIEGSLADEFDRDLYRVLLQEGDVFGGALFLAPAGGFEPATLLSVMTPSGLTRVCNVNGGTTSLYPAANPLPRALQTSGSSSFPAAVSYVQSTTGSILVEVRPIAVVAGQGEVSYTLRLFKGRNPLESGAPGAVQAIFVDFDGAVVDRSLFADSPPGDLRTLSPLSSFLSNWGLTAADESAVVDSVMAKVQQKLDLVTATSGGHGFMLLNSRDDPDPGADPLTTRIVVGGTIAQLGISTIGIAESIDPGNYAPNETAITLLDVLSSTDPVVTISINNVARDPSFTMIEAIGRVVGNVVAHEIGHTFGSWHTDNTNTVRSLMDQGGPSLLVNLFGVGPDGVMGTSDDEQPIFQPDRYSPGEDVHETSVCPDSLEDVFSRTLVAMTLGPALPCPADLTGDGVVDGADLLTLQGAWGACPQGLPCPADLDGDGVVGGSDLLILLGAYGPCP